MKINWLNLLVFLICNSIFPLALGYFFGASMMTGLGVLLIAASLAIVSKALFPIFQ